MRDRPGILVFFGGVSFVLAAAALGAYLAHEALARVFGPDLNSSLSYDQRFDGIRIGADHKILANVNALMWMVLGLGACMTLAGLRMMTRTAPGGQSLPPIGNVRDLFENPD